MRYPTPLTVSIEPGRQLLAQPGDVDIHHVGPHVAKASQAPSASCDRVSTCPAFRIMCASNANSRLESVNMPSGDSSSRR